MPVMVIACYKPKPGKNADLLALVKTHLPVLRGEGLAEEGPSVCGKAEDGTVVEVFCWKSQAAIDAAHKNEAVLAIWDRFAKVCDFVNIGDVPEAKQMFAGFASLNLEA